MQKQSSLVDYLFLRFAFQWDSKWRHILKDCEEEKRKMWAVAISGLTRKQLDFGIDVATSKFEWPPEPRKFIECCTGKKKEAVLDSEERYCDLNGGHYTYCAINDCRAPATMYSTSWVCNKHWSEGK